MMNYSIAVMLTDEYIIPHNKAFVCSVLLELLSPAEYIATMKEKDLAHTIHDFVLYFILGCIFRGAGQ